MRHSPAPATVIAILALVTGCAVSREAASPPPADRSGYLGSRDRQNVVVFVHGVMGSASGTWRNAATGAYFPHLVQSDPDFQNYSIYLVQYASPALGRAATIAEVAARELQRMKDDGVLDGKRRVVIVAHSMGGLVAKRMLIAMNRVNFEELERLDRIKGVIFLSTPSQGAPAAEYGAWLSLNQQFANMAPADLNAFLQTVDDDWKNLLHDRDLLRIPIPRSSCAYETQPTAGIMVVNRVYAATTCDGSGMGMDANHTAMASPASARSDPYPWVKARILEAVDTRDVSRQAMLARARDTDVTAALPRQNPLATFVLEAADPNLVGKDSIETLFRDIEPRLKAGERITSLTFNSWPERRAVRTYYENAIDEYLRALGKYDAFRYVVFLERGRYMGLMGQRRFTELFRAKPQEVTRWINAGDFTALQAEGMQGEAIQTTRTALDALEQLARTGAAGLGVVAPDGKFVGVASRQGILDLLGSRAAARP